MQSLIPMQESHVQEMQRFVRSSLPLAQALAPPLLCVFDAISVFVNAVGTSADEQPFDAIFVFAEKIDETRETSLVQKQKQPPEMGIEYT